MKWKSWDWWSTRSRSKRWVIHRDTSRISPAPHIAEVEKNARIAQAQADQAATEREQQANAQKAGFTRDSEIKQAGARAEVQAAQAEADQAGPLAQAKAAQKVTEEQAALAAKQAEKREGRTHS